MSRCVCGEVELGAIDTGVGAGASEFELAGVIHRSDRPCYVTGELELLSDAGWPHVAALVRPGDVFVIATDHELRPADAERWRRRTLEQLPGLADVVIFPAGYVAAVYRPTTIDADGR